MVKVQAITFSREIEGSIKDLTVPENFIKDLDFSGDEHLMIMIRVVGTDYKKVIEFFNGSEGENFTINTTEKISGKFILSSMYMDEGPPLNVDINSEIPMVRLILDFKKQS